MASFIILPVVLEKERNIRLRIKDLLPTQNSSERPIITPYDYLIKVLNSYIDELLSCTQLNEHGLDKRRDKIKMIEKNKVDLLLILKLNTRDTINGIYSTEELIKKFPVA